MCLLAVLALSIVTACSGSDSPSSTTKSGEPQKIVIAYLGQTGATSTLIMARKWMEKAYPDTEIKWKAFDNGADVVNAMAAGSIDLGQAGSVPVVSAVAKDVDIEVPFFLDIIGKGESLAVRKSIKSFDDLRGKKIGTPFGTTDHYSLIKSLALNDLTEKDVKVLDMQIQDITAAYERGDIDGCYCYSPGLDAILSNDGHILFGSDDLAAKGLPTADMGVVRPAFGKQFPGVIKKWLQLQNDAVEVFNKGVDAPAKEIADFLDAPESGIKNGLEGSVFVPIPDQLSDKYFGQDGKGDISDGLLEIGDFLKDQGSLSKPPSLEALHGVITSKYLKAASGTG